MKQYGDLEISQDKVNYWCSERRTEFRDYILDAADEG
jgi:hypothetical protein